MIEIIAIEHSSAPLTVVVSYRYGDEPRSHVFHSLLDVNTFILELLRKAELVFGSDQTKKITSERK